MRSYLFLSIIDIVGPVRKELWSEKIICGAKMLPCGIKYLFVIYL